jgi:hypothetical protein
MGADVLLLALGCPTPVWLTCVLGTGVVNPLPPFPASFHAWPSSAAPALCLASRNNASEDIVHAAVVGKLVEVRKPDNQPAGSRLTRGTILKADELALLACKLLYLIRQHFQLNGKFPYYEVWVFPNNQPAKVPLVFNVPARQIRGVDPS